MKVIVLWDVVSCNLVEIYQHFGSIACLHLSGRLYVAQRLKLLEGISIFCVTFLIISGRNCFFTVSSNYIGVLQIKVKFSYCFFVLTYYTKFLQIPFSVLKDCISRHNLMYVHLQFMQLTHNIWKSDLLQARWLVLIPETGILLITQLAVRWGLCQK